MQKELTCMRALWFPSLTKTLGAASGVCCGCLLGMLQLLVLDLDRADRLKHQQQVSREYRTKQTRNVS